MLPSPAPRSRALFVALRRAVPSSAAIASVVLLATCDLDKVTSPKTKGGEPSVSFSIAGADQVILAGTTPLSVSPALNGVSVLWSSSAPGVATVNSETGVVTGVGIGTATIMARVLGMELDTGFTQTKPVTVRYKGIRIAAIDSITGLGHTRNVIVNGLDNADAVQAGALSATLSVHDSGSTNATFASLTGAIVKGLKNGTVYLKATFNPDLSDSVKVRVRQVAKNITFSDTVFTSNALNFNRSMAVTVRDVADSLIATPTLRWRSSDTNKVSIDSMTGVFRVKVKDTARVFVRMDTVIRSQKVRVIQVPGIVDATAGTAQTAEVLQAVPGFVAVVVKDSGGTAMSGVEVTFRTVPGDSGVIADSVQITDVNGEARLNSWTLGPRSGAQSVIATAGSIERTVTATALPGAPRKLAFSVHPASAAVAAVIAPAIKVQVQDSVGNLITDATNDVTLAFNFNPNPSATLGGTLTKAAVNGVATFDNVTVSAGGLGFVLLASATDLSSAVSNSFNAFGAATKLGFVTQPIGSTAGGSMQSVQVAVQDADGATVTTATDNVTLSLGNAGSATLGGTKTVAAVNGIATFTDLSVSVAGSGYTLIAAATGRTGATSSAFTVAPVGTPARFAFSVHPANSVSGQAISPAVKVQVLDENGALVTSSTQQITLTLEDGTSLSGISAVSAVAGEATFSNVIVNLVRTGHRLVASATGTSISSATSNPFNVTPGAATKLGFVQDPTHTVVNQTMAPAVRVAVQDAQGNTVTTHPVTAVSMALTNGCTASALSGNAPTNTASGVATFGVLAVSQQFSNCRLSASATGLQSATSNLFNIVAANGAVRLRFTTQPTSAATAGSSMSGGTVNFQDASGNNVTAPASTNVSISVLSGPAGIACCGTTGYFTNTAQSFPGISFQKAGTYRLLISATGYRPDTSAEFTISAGTANRVGFVEQPTNIVAGVPFPNTIKVAVQDQFGNTVTGATDVITISSSLQVSPFTSRRLNNGLFSIAATAVNGVATFNGLSVRGAGTPLRLHANTPSFGASSNTFSVFAGPLTALGFRVPLSSNQNAGQTLRNENNVVGIEIQGQDSVGNVITTFENPVTLTLVGGNPAAVLNGTKTVAPASGVSTFADLSINEAGSGYQLSASASGVSTATSSAFQVHPGAASQIMWLDQPQNTFANAPLNPSGQLPRVANVDQFGNVVSDGWGMKITILNPTVGMSLKNNGSETTEFNLGPDCSNGCTGFAELPNTLTINTHGTGIQLLATSHNTERGTATSVTFDIGAFDAQAKLGFSKQPTNTSYGITFNDTVTVTVQDQYGNTDTTAGNFIDLSLSANPGGATLSMTSLAAVNGVAKFQPLTLDKAGTGYAITAATSGLTSAVSNAFNVTLPGTLSFTNYICDMTRQGDKIYFIDCASSGSLWSIPVTGGTPVQEEIGLPIPLRIASDANNVYWIEQGASAGSGAVKKWNIATGNVTTMASGLSDVHWEKNTFEIDGTNVYFVARSGPGTTRAIRSVPLSVGGPTTPTDVVAVGSCTGCLPYFTVDGGQIFFYDFSTDAIARVPVTGGVPTAVSTTGVGNTQMLAMSGTTLLLSQHTNLKTIADAATIGSPATPTPQIESGINFQTWLVDGAFLYVNNNGTLTRYSLSDFGSATSLGVGALHNNQQQGFVTGPVDVFAYQQNGQLVKVPK